MNFELFLNYLVTINSSNNFDVLEHPAVCFVSGKWLFDHLTDPESDTSHYK